MKRTFFNSTCTRNINRCILLTNDYFVRFPNMKVYRFPLTFKDQGF